MNILVELRDKAFVLKTASQDPSRLHRDIIMNQVAGFLEEMANDLDKSFHQRIEKAAGVVAQFFPELPISERREIVKHILSLFAQEVNNA